jgi:hypothetical protein
MATNRSQIGVFEGIGGSPLSGAPGLARHLHREDQVLRQPQGIKARRLGSLGQLDPPARPRAHRNSDLHP